MMNIDSDWLIEDQLTKQARGSGGEEDPVAEMPQREPVMRFFCSYDGKGIGRCGT